MFGSIKTPKLGGNDLPNVIKTKRKTKNRSMSSALRVSWSGVWVMYGYIMHSYRLQQFSKRERQRGRRVYIIPRWIGTFCHICNGREYIGPGNWIATILGEKTNTYVTWVNVNSWRSNILLTKKRRCALNEKNGCSLLQASVALSKSFIHFCYVTDLILNLALYNNWTTMHIT